MKLENFSSGNALACVPTEIQEKTVCSNYLLYSLYICLASASATQKSLKMQPLRSVLSAIFLEDLRNYWTLFDS